MTKFGPGHFNYTFMVAEKGFNELDMKLLDHLILMERPHAFVRSQCDKNITAAAAEEVCTKEIQKL